MVNDFWHENSQHNHIAITHVAFHIHLPHLPSFGIKKAPSWLIRRGLPKSESYLIFQGISTLLELAPASRRKRDRLLWLLRASPSATLDKITMFNLPEHDNPCQEKNYFLPFFFTPLDKVHEAVVQLFFDTEILGQFAHFFDGYRIKIF